MTGDDRWSVVVVAVSSVVVTAAAVGRVCGRAVAIARAAVVVVRTAAGVARPGTAVDDRHCDDDHQDTDHDPGDRQAVRRVAEGQRTSRVRHRRAAGHHCTVINQTAIVSSFVR